MESKIIKLSDDLISKIAAGEVIERPASCIKELVENSIDAGATHISCEVKGNGVPEMRISDNGIGMSIQELELAVKPHTTSKLKDEEGLFEIRNFGFRGEALPSMCRVAELEISSRPKTQEAGGYIRVRNEEIIEKRETPRALGTTITIRSLFYNMPVR
ncbi:ATP-binding protein, partial [candidate division WOR-3 bacterium]|nr:ATP-binding protein [candidate division WOR-3 bacterium]